MTVDLEHLAPPTWDPWAGFVSPVPADGLDGHPTRHQASTARWRRTTWGRYVAADVEPTPRQRILELLPKVPSYGGITGWAALHLVTGSPWLDGTRADGSSLDVDIATCGQFFRPQPGVRGCRERLRPDQLITWRGIPMTTPLRSVTYAMRHLGSPEAATTFLETAAREDLVSKDEVAAVLFDHNNFDGAPWLRAGWDEVDENVWSPRESALKQVWRAAGLPRPLCNIPVFDERGRHLGTPDLLDPSVGLAIEYDGGHHLSGEQRSHDVLRSERLVRSGLHHVVVLRHHMLDREHLVARLLTARDHAARSPARCWTLERPDWWIPTHTVALRRALTRGQRARLLAYRRPAA